MSVSDPGTATIFTQDVVLCLLKASTICCMPVVSGGVCEVQNRTCDVPALHPGRGAADWPPPPPQAQTTTTSEISEAFKPRPRSNVIAFSSVRNDGGPCAFFPVGCSPDRGESAPAQGPQLLHRIRPRRAKQQTNIADMTCQGQPSHEIGHVPGHPPDSRIGSALDVLRCLRTSSTQS